MKKLWVGIIVIAVIAGGIYAVFRRPGGPSKLSGNTTYLVITEWGVKLPISAFGDNAAKGYIEGKIDTPEGAEGLVLLDQPLTEIESDLGSDIVAQARQCLGYYHGIYRLEKNGTPTGKVLGDYMYFPMTPQSTCATEPNDMSLSEFNSHLIDSPSSAALIKDLVRQ